MAERAQTGTSRVVRDGKRVLLVPPADIDVAGGMAFADTLAHACERSGSSVVVDLSDVRFCDSTAVLILINALKHALACGCELELRDPATLLTKMTHALGLSDVLDVAQAEPSASPEPSGSRDERAAASLA